MDQKQIASIKLALDTFKKVPLDRLEGFSRTVERELNRALDARPLPTIPGVAPASQMETKPSPAEHAEQDAKRAQRKHAKPVETKSKKKKA